MLDQATNRVALVDYSDGHVLRQFDTETDRGSGITFDGQAIWIASTYNRLLVRADAQNGANFEKDAESRLRPGEVGTARPRTPSPPAPMAWNGARANCGLQCRRRFAFSCSNPDNGSARNSFPAPGVRPHGIGWDPDGSLWCAESIYRSFFKMDPSSGKILQQLMLPAEEPLADGVVLQPHGMTVWKGQIWFSVAETGEVYRTPLPA